MPIWWSRACLASVNHVHVLQRSSISWTPRATGTIECSLVSKRAGGQGRNRSSSVAHGITRAMSPRAEIRIAQDSFTWATEAATLTQELRRQAVKERGLFLLALSGGRTPEQLYRRLASSPFCDQGDWTNTEFFFSDERCVPAHHPDSNFNLADETLSPSGHPFTSHSSYGLRTGRCRPCGSRLRTSIAYCHQDAARRVAPVGSGLAGHRTRWSHCSLFPGTDAVQERQRCVTVGYAPSGLGPDSPSPYL